MDPFYQLMSQSSGSSVAPETLEMLGRQASQLFQSKGVPLNDAITQVIANHPEVGNEHVQRIIEFANTVTFQEMFQNSSDKNIHFDVADPGTVLRDIKDGGSPAHAGKPLQDYNKLPQRDTSDLDNAFQSQFLGHNSNEEQAKLASVIDHERHSNPIEDVYDTHQRLVASRSKLASSYETMHGLMFQMKSDLYSEVKSQVLDPDGGGLGGVIGFLEKVASREDIESLLVPLTEQLINDNFPHKLLADSLKKTAGAVINMDHPLIAITNSITKLAAEMVNCSQALDDLDEMITRTSNFLKTSGSLTTGVKGIIGNKGIVPAGVRQRFPSS